MTIDFRARLARSPTLKLTLSVWVLFVLIQLVRMVAWRGGLPPWTLSFYGMVLSTGIGLSLVLLAFVRSRRGQAGAANWIAIAAAAGAVALAQSFLDHGAYRLLIWLNGEAHVTSDFDGVSLNFMNYGWLYGLYAVALELIATVDYAAEQARRAAEARELAQEARLQALRLQLNPHFLFNTLNALSGLIVAGRNKQADLMLEKLAAFLRSSLDAPQRSLTPLAEELGAVEAYLDVESVRFGPALQIDIDCPEPLMGALVPPFILQPLVENAVKHAVVPSGGAGLITIRASTEREHIVMEVIDTGAPVSGRDSLGPEGSGIGLPNIRQRLVALYGEAGELSTWADAGGHTARLRLPLTFSSSAEAAR